ncbi:MAG: DHH family phosphoesterase [Bacteroidales bacterium]|nr:DHH family phosphoesterase [Bacteroidales bacterium]
MTTLRKADIDKLDELLGRAERIVISTHLHPDGDAVGSAVAMMHYLEEKRGKAPTVVINDPMPESIAFLDCPGILIASQDAAGATALIAAADLIVSLDYNDFSRAGDALCGALRASGAAKVLIDHHLNPSAGDFGLCFSETEISSASELLYHILMKMPDVDGDASRLPLSAATALMTGMTTDTNNFANSVFPTTLEMASALLAAGVDRDAIIMHVYNSFRENRVKAMGYLLDRKLRILDNGVAYMVLSGGETADMDIRDGETEGFVNIPLTIGRVKMSVFLRQDDGYFRVSVRSRRGTSANRFAAAFFHGGGHEQAAGGRLYIPDDVADADGAALYIERAAARFMENDSLRNN